MKKIRIENHLNLSIFFHEWKILNVPKERIVKNPKANFIQNAFPLVFIVMLIKPDS